MTTIVVRWLRASALAMVTVAVVSGGLRLCIATILEALRLLPRLDREPADRALGVVVGAVLGALLLCALLWLVLAVSVCLTEALRSPHRTASSGQPGVTTLLRPRTVRLVVAAAVGAGGLASPAAAADVQSSAVVALAQPVPDRQPVAPGAVEERDAPLPVRLLAGLPVPDRRTGGVDRSDRSGPTTHPSPAASTRIPTVVGVRRGDSLWGVTVSVLAEGAVEDPDAAVIDRGWRLLYAANRRVVGPDPDLIQPGTVLEVPRRPPFTDLDPGGPR